MKKLLTILILLLAVASQGWAKTGTTTMIYPNHNVGNWNGLKIEKSIYGTLAENNVILIYVTDIAANDVKLRLEATTTPNYTLLGEEINSMSSESPVAITLSSTDVNNLGNNDLWFTGTNYTITKVTKKESSSSDKETTLYGDPAELFNWSGGISISKINFANAKVGDLITANFNIPTPCVNLQNSSWSTINNGTNDATINLTDQSFVTFTLSSANATDLNTGGLIVKGVDYTLTKVTRTPSGGSETTIWDSTDEGKSEIAMGVWKNYLVISHDAYSSYAENDVITIYVKDYNSQMQFKDGNGWIAFKDDGNQDIGGVDLSSTSSSTTLTINSSILSALQANDLILQGKNCQLASVTLTHYTYELTTSATNGSISVSTNGGTSTTEETSFEYGTELTLTATPATGYSFTSWTIGPSGSSTSNPLTHTMTADVAITANFTAKTIKNLSTGSKKINGSTSVTIPKTMFAKAVAGDVITVAVSSVQSGAKYTLKGWSQDERAEGNKNWSSFAYEQELATNATSFTCTLTDDILDIIKNAGLSIEGGTYTCGNVTLTTAGDVPAAQTHSNPNYTLTVTDPVGGTIAIKKGNETVSAGSFELDTELTLTATANDGYVFNKWTKNGTALEDTSNPLAITMTADVTMAAIFKGTPLVNEERRTLWEKASGQALDWSLMFDQTSAVGEIVETGEILIFTVKEVGANPKIWLMSNDGNTTLATLDPLIVGENRLSITADMKTAMEEGFKFKGGDATITKIELYKPTPITKLAEEETRTLWVNASGEALIWENKIAIDRAAEWGAVLEEDERIIIHVKAKETGDNVWPTVQLQNDTEKIASTANLLNDLTVPCDITITLTAEMVNKMKNGFSITGDKATITKAVLYKPTMPAKTVHTLNSTETAISGEANVTVAAAKFANISAYDVLTVNFAITASPAKVILKGNGENGGWDYLKEMEFKSGETLFALPLTPAMTSNLKKNGLQITGSGYTFKSVSIKTAGEVPSDEEKKDDDEEKKDDDDEETIIDEKTGEADLTVLSAQDDSKTTLTENEDGSITMTTTEPYCAAQIWFNDPEPVAGNVLKVELAESSVNVTITVKYTDGTESQMSANTMVAKARGETRSASGTTVEVPLESGKEVQNIEVKNNVAGTITIKKMQVTTVNVFTNGVANLSMLKPQSNATYDTAAHTLATTKGWTGATISPVANENVSGKELLIEFADASKVKVAVKYRTDVEGPSTIMEKAAKAVRLALDNTKNIQEISIQPTEASIVTFKKIAVNSEESDDGSLKPGKTITLWENAAGETLAWNEVAKQDASVGETLKEYDELLITVSGVTKDCDWPKVFIRDASSEQAGNEVLLNDIGSFPYTVRIVLTGEMAQQLKKGFSICGDGVTVTKLQVYRPEAPKPGDIHLADLNYGYNSSYDKGTHTITTTARWAARGWEIGDKRYNDKNLITVKFEAVDFPVTLKMEYTTGLQTAQATSVGVPAGRTELLLEIPSGISRLNRVYIIYENPGSIKLTEASVTYQDNLKLSTAIRSFEADGVIRDGRYDSDGWYNLRGMRIAEPKTSGVYIHGGKKVVIY